MLVESAKKIKLEDKGERVMAYEMKPNSGSLWTAKSKKSAKSPDITGKLKVVMSDLDVETDYDERGNQIKVAVMKLSAWRKTTKEEISFFLLV